MFDVDKFLKGLGKDKKLVKLNLGVGPDIRKNWVNHDQISGQNIDYVFDLNVAPYPIKDSFVDVIYASHVLEHVDDIFICVNEIYRILKPKGLLIARTPHYLSNCAWGDLSHKRGFGYQSFLHLVDDIYCNQYKLRKWASIEFCRLVFFKKWFYPWNYLIEPLSNIKPIYFENTLGNIFPPFEVVTILKK